MEMVLNIESSVLRIIYPDYFFNLLEIKRLKNRAFRLLFCSKFENSRRFKRSNDSSTRTPLSMVKRKLKELPYFTQLVRERLTG